MSKRVVAVFLFLAGLALSSFAQEAVQAASSAAVPLAAWKYLSAAIAVSFACIGGGIAVGKLGAAAMGAIAEDPSLSGKALPYLGLAEGICLWGFLVALLILML
ncbi:MAG: ATP synthase subunit C [Rectinemataceae bacterium]|jgi:V/A-type H+-transporting ATPase subunit K